MRVSAFFIGVFLTTILSSTCLAAILMLFSPSSADFLVLLLFYLSLFISVTGLTSLIGLSLRRLSRKSRILMPANRQMWDAFRQGAFLAVILIGTLLLQSQGILYWWTLLILVIFVGIIEFFSLKKV